MLSNGSTSSLHSKGLNMVEVGAAMLSMELLSYELIVISRRSEVWLTRAHLHMTVGICVYIERLLQKSEGNLSDQNPG